MGKIKIALLKGGTSKERNISIMTADEIMQAFDKNKYHVVMIELPEIKSCTWIEALIAEKPDFVFIALHGGLGEDGSVQGLLECLGIPYCGSKVLGSAICMDKCLSKSIMKSQFIPVAEDVFIGMDEEYTLFLDKIKRLGFPLVVKPNKGGSSIGITIVETMGALAGAVQIVKELGDDILVEKFIDGAEVACAVIERKEGAQVMPVLDILISEGFYDYDAKYKDERSHIAYSALPQFLKVMIQEIAKKAFYALHCNGYARVDMIVCQEQVYVLEVDTLPGMTGRSLFPRSLKDNEMAEFLDELVMNQLKPTQNG